MYDVSCLAVDRWLAYAKIVRNKGEKSNGNNAEI